MNILESPPIVLETVIEGVTYQVSLHYTPEEKGGMESEPTKESFEIVACYPELNENIIVDHLKVLRGSR